MILYHEESAWTLSLFSNYEDCIGAIREDFAISMLSLSGYIPQYLKSTRGRKTPDFVIPWDEEGCEKASLFMWILER